MNEDRMRLILENSDCRFGGNDVRFESKLFLMTTINYHCRKLLITLARFHKQNIFVKFVVLSHPDVEYREFFSFLRFFGSEKNS